MQKTETKSLPKEDRPHTLQIEDRKKITMTGVESVEAFSPREIQLTVSGGKLTVAGSDLKIVNFSKENGGFFAVGKVDSVKYSVLGGWKRWFK
jgi:sporulation protein YabP